MTTRSYYQWFASGLFLGSVLVLGIVMTTPQPRADSLTYIGLIAGLLLAISSFCAFLGLEIRRLLSKGKLSQPAAIQALRQGIEVAVLLVASAGLAAINSLGWWEGGLLAASIVFAELALSLRRFPFPMQVAK